MSERTISENLEYTIDNQGVHYSAPFMDITTTSATTNSTVDGNFDITGNWTLNGEPLVIGTINSSNNVFAGTPPTRVLDTYWPREVWYTLSANLVANTPQTLDWATKTLVADGFAFNTPSQGPASDFLEPIGGTTTDWQFKAGGYYTLQLSAVPTVTLGNNQELKLTVELSLDNGGTWNVEKMDQLQKGGAGTPTVDGIGTGLVYIAAYQGSPPGGHRVRFVMTCTENKTVNIKLKWILIGRD